MTLHVDVTTVVGGFSLAANFNSDGPNGTQRKMFHAATTSMRQ